MATAEKVPAYIKKEDADQSQFGAGDIEFPQLKLAQSTSDEVKKQKEAFIKGLEAGMYFNSITKEVYGENVDIQPIFYFRETVVYKEEDGPVEYYNYVVCINGNFKDLALWALKSTAVKVAKRLNALIKLKEYPSYAFSYKLGANFVEGDDGDWHTPTANQNGYANEANYKLANQMYDGFKANPPKLGFNRSGEATLIEHKPNQSNDDIEI